MKTADVLRLAANAPEYNQEESTAFLCACIHELGFNEDITSDDALDALNEVDRFINHHITLGDYYRHEIGRERPSNAEARLFWHTCADIVEQESK